MNFPFLTSMLIFILLLHYNINKGKNTQAKKEADFWAKEFSANHVRKKSLDDLEYIVFTADSFYPVNLLDASLCTSFLSQNEEIKEILSRFLFLEEQKIVNLSCYTNTDLKYKYGVANLNLLTEYDSNYNELITLLHKYGSCYYTNGFEEQAVHIFEYAISIGTDISSTYEMCGEYYYNNNLSDKLQWLKNEAEKISTSRKSIIVQKLQKFDPCNG